jgi:hypothetical protein
MKWICPPGKGIQLHSHPYAEVFYVISGHTDFLRIDEQGQEEWVRCGSGDTLIARANTLHAFHNRTDKPTRFLSSSGYYHELAPSCPRRTTALAAGSPIAYLRCYPTYRPVAVCVLLFFSRLTTAYRGVPVEPFVPGASLPCAL